MKKLFNYLKCKITGYYKRIITGKCGLHLYYNGCNCKDCQTYQKIEIEEASSISKNIIRIFE